MDEEVAPPPPDDDNNNNVVSNSPDDPAAEVNSTSSGGHHHRRSKREKYSPSRFVARPSSRTNKNSSLTNDDVDDIDIDDDVGTAEENVEKSDSPTTHSTRPFVDGGEEDMLNSENETTSPPPDDSNDNHDGNDAAASNETKIRRRTLRAHAAPGSYIEPPDNEDFERMVDNDTTNNKKGPLKKKSQQKQPPSSSTATTIKKVITKTCNDANNTVVQISTVKLYNPKSRRSLCKVIGCGKADQVGSGGFCRTHFRLLNEDDDDDEEEEEIDEEEVDEEEVDEEEEEEDSKPPAAAAVADPSPDEDSKPRKNSDIRILSGEFAGLTGRITTVKVGGWCFIANPKVTKPVRMSLMEVVRHNGPPSTPKTYLDRRKKFDSLSRGKRSSGSGSGRPVRERKPPQSLLMAAAAASSSSPTSMSPSRRPRRSTRGGEGGTSVSSASASASASSPKRDSSVRRSKRGPTPSPKYYGNDDDDEEEYDEEEDEEEEEEEEEVRPRGRRGRAVATTPSKPSSSSPRKKDSHLCKAPSCTKFRQGHAKGYCSSCFKSFLAGELDATPPKDPRACKLRDCTKYNQWGCEGYCMSHYREFVLEGGEEEEEDEEEVVVSPPNKRARRTLKQEAVKEELVDDDNDESIFDDPPRKGGTNYGNRLFCKVKLCDKWSQGQTKNGMCYKHFKQYGFRGGKKKTAATKKKSRSRGAVAKSPPAAAAAKAAVAEEILGEIEVGSLVMVKERRGAGMNKPGGVGRVTKVYSVDEEVMVYDVKYILGGREKGLDAKSLWLHDINAKSPMKPPPSFEGEEEDDAAMLDEDDESIQDDELEGYDEFSFSQLDVPDQSVLDQRALRREEQLNALSGNNNDYDDHNLRLEGNWECAMCGGLNRPTATSRCTTCQSYRVEKNASEDALNERTRYELLNGNDFWICTNCVIGVPSLFMPCGRCHSSIPFVPLTMPEFEDFVRNQRRIKRNREEEIQREWDQKLEEISEEWGERKEKEPAASTKSKQQKVEWSKLPCKVIGCKEICAPNCEGFCEDHSRTVIILEEPEEYPLVRPEDKQLITDYFYLAYEQFRPCVLQEWERTRKHKDSKVPRGHPGIACKHCFGRENPTLRSMGRYFPTTDSSLYQQTFTSNCVKHLLECPHCPSKVRLDFAMVWFLSKLVHFF